MELDVKGTGLLRFFPNGGPKGGGGDGLGATGRRSSNDMLWQHSQNTFCMAQASARVRPHGNLHTGTFTHAAVLADCKHIMRS